MTEIIKAPGHELEQRGSRSSNRKTKTAAVPTRILRLTFILYASGFLFFGAAGTWAAYGKIQGGVVASGAFEVDGNLRVVDHLEGGIVSDIHVSEGDDVTAGEVILTLEDKRYDAQYSIYRGQLAGALARSARLQAEALGSPELATNDELAELVAEDPTIGAIVDAQQALLQSNIAADDGEVSIYGERILQLDERKRAIDERLAAYADQLELISEEVARLDEALEAGLTRRDNVVRRREQLIVLHGRVSEAQAERQDIVNQIGEMKERQLHVRRERQATIANELQANNETIVDLRQRIATALDVIDRMEVRAPISGRIIGFDINTVGAVVSPGQRILQIVPDDARFTIEARVSTGDIDEIELGDPARVRLSAYSYRKVAPVEGRVSYISASAMFDASEQANYYEIKVEVSKDALDSVPGLMTLPGMPVQVMVATGEHSVLTHLLDPVIGGLETAFVEGD